jgi:PAS domain-containing protein
VEDHSAEQSETIESRLHVLFERSLGIPNRSATSPKEFAEAVERTPEFHAVLLAAATLDTTEAHSKWITGQDRIVVGTFLRLSGAYLSLHAGTLPDAAEVARSLRSQLLRSQIEVTHFAPIELVELSKNELRFGPFRIEQFSAAELDRLLQNPIRRVFYPWAVVDTRTLEDYSFLVATETIDVRPPLDLAPLFDSRVKHTYSDLPGVLERALYPVVLYYWVDRFSSKLKDNRPVKRNADESIILPDIPFFLSSSNYLLDTPHAALDLSVLAREPYIDQDGEEVGDHPSYAYYFDESDTQELETQLQEFEARLTLIEQHQPAWRFVFTALGFLTKAFRGRGIEQLLWHVTTIEAVLGQNVDGLTSLLNRRLRAIFGQTDSDRTRIKKQFQALYDFRSDLVHGNTKLADQEIMSGHLTEARELARGTVAWLTALLHHIASQHRGEGEPVPTRDEILLVLDMPSATRAAVAGILQTLPSQFPGVDDWLA